QLGFDRRCGYPVPATAPGGPPSSVQDPAMAPISTPQPAPPKENSWLADQSMQRKMMLAIGLLLGLFLSANVITLDSLQKQENARHWAGHTYQVLLQIDMVGRAAQSRQVGARGFM